MTIGEIKREALQIIDAYSENGYIVSEKEPETADYLLRISGFINQAILRVITVYPLMKRLRWEELTSHTEEDGVHYVLPKDFLEIGVIQSSSKEEWGIGEYSIIGGELIALPRRCPVCYYRALPKRVKADAGESEEPEIAEAGGRLIPIYVAGMLIAEENPALSTRLLNQFESFLSARSGGASLAHPIRS